MNSLSWLLYLSDVAGSAKTASGTILGVGAFVGAFTAFMGPMTVDMFPGAGDILKRLVAPFVTVMGIALVVVIVAPSRETLMLIAASEVGETVLASETAQNVGGEAGALATDSLKLLRKYVTEQLGEASE